MKLRLSCRLLGCRCDDYEPVCVRCGADVHEEDWITYGWLEPVQMAYRRVLWLMQRNAPF